MNYWHIKEFKCEIHKFDKMMNSLQVINYEDKGIMYLDMDCIMEIA